MNFLGSDDYDSVGFRTDGEDMMTDGYNGVVFGNSQGMRGTPLGAANGQPVAGSQKMLRGPIGRKMISSKLISTSHSKDGTSSPGLPPFVGSQAPAPAPAPV